MNAFIATLSRIGFLIRKELLALFKEPSARLLLIAPALIQSLLFGYGATFELTNAPYAVLDQSRGQASAELLRRVDGTGVFKLKAMLSTAPDIAPAIEDSNVLLVISIPPDFESQLAAGQAASLQLILDGRNSSTAAAAAAQINAIVADYNQQHGSGAQVKIERRAWFNPNLESRWNIMPALIASLLPGCEALHRIDAAENHIRDLGFRAYRVRYHDERTARIEVGTDERARGRARRIGGALAARAVVGGVTFVAAFGWLTLHARFALQAISPSPMTFTTREGFTMSLPTREQALSMLLGTLKAPIEKFVRTVAAPHTKLVRTVAAVRDAKQAAGA